MEDKDIKEEVYKCSKCALCKSVCPVYLATKNEMYLPRGRFIILNRFFNNHEKLSPQFIQDLDKCLYCNLCKDFCPSSIDSAEIFTHIKNKYKKRALILSFSFRYKIWLLFSGLKNIFSQKINIKKFKGTRDEKIIYFEGCINRYVNSDDKNAVLSILNTLGYKNIKINHLCCGYPLLTDGDIKSYKKNSEKIINSLDKDVDYIICSCDSCYSELQKILENSENKAKLITIDELLSMHNYDISDEKVIYFKPLTRKGYGNINKNIKQLNPQLKCSLMENFLMYKNKSLSEMMREQMQLAQMNIEDNTIITTCQLTRIGLQSLLGDKEVLMYSEYLNKK